MVKARQSGMGDELFGTRLGEARDATGPVKGEFVAPPDVPDVDERADALPDQEEFWRAPVRFGSIPVESTPLGWDRRRGFRKWYPQVMLPTQVVERVSFGHPALEPNRLFWGDNLHVMRQLPSESIDLIYIDPPFFSGRQYNVIFGDQNELRSFADIWEGGMPGYLIWLNARLYEMKRLLKKTGSIYVHLDWHAVHYVKAEMDKIFGHDNFRNQIVWHYRSWPTKARQFQRNHDVVLFYSRSIVDKRTFNVLRMDRTESTKRRFGHAKIQSGFDQTGRRLPSVTTEDSSKGVAQDDVWEIGRVPPIKQLYPTQKPNELVERIIESSSVEGQVVADFFCGGGTFVLAAQRMGRCWLACDQSRVAVAIAADQLTRQAEQMPLEAKSFAVPDFTIEHWGIYEAKRLAETPADQFREFILRAFGAVPDNTQPGIHGHKGAVPVWVGESAQTSQVTAQHVADFANAVRRTVRYQQDNLRDGIMLAWAFRPDAFQAADRLRQQEATDLNFIRLDLLRVDSPRFREHVQALSTDRADYSTFLTFVQPPRVEVGWKKLTGLAYRFDASETAVMNQGAKIINVQWDFDYRGRFTSTQGYSFVRTAKREPVFQVDYTFPAYGRHTIACKVQDDAGGEGVRVAEVGVK